jgi:hypothetical protein
MLPSTTMKCLLPLVFTPAARQAGGASQAETRRKTHAGMQSSSTLEGLHRMASCHCENYSSTLAVE